MTRIPLKFGKDEARLYLTAAVKFAEKPPIPITFVVDTGSANTFVDEQQTSAMRIFARSYKFLKYSHLGGTMISHHEVGGVKMTFYTSEKARKDIKFDGITIVKNAKPGKSAIYEPVSIIGMNFLEETNASLYVNPSKGEAYIELE